MGNTIKQNGSQWEAPLNKMDVKVVYGNPLNKLALSGGLCETPLNKMANSGGLWETPLNKMAVYGKFN